ncbi:Eco57I restriction-modification methylase domain-containing protein [Neisseria montereyensis]|uniref:Eco57I restriction-modification methylase domain-containing protein n=1 Tax=Neisseria montereyensis TaxID=2973938 RepID=A0ABT2FBE7_9NEIS|nr:Eco57I restriction-modification methylase domain-containing protein [Neisseria montereyensis]MCS4533541.1 Eco57I restriction-modification methylase domain-containing protein [Neisseria montereyensis]
MKFDVVVGNPPYQESREDTRDDSIYHYFYDLAEKAGFKYCLISPARFLFNAGSTDRNWNKKMLSDKHINVEYYEQNSANVFQNTDIKGGVAIIYRDKDKNFGEIGTFTVFKVLNHIVKKVSKLTNATMSSIISGQGIYKFTPKMHEDYPEVIKILSKNHPNDVGTNALTTLHNILFYPEKPNDKHEYVAVLGRFQHKRALHYIRKDYLNEPFAFDKWKVILPKANGNGKLGEPLSSPFVGRPLIGFTQTFISIGAFDSEIEAQNTLKYIKSKFTRVMLGVLKITQDNPRNKWEKVPLQNFTCHSDIDWTKSISEIDQQLYKKYGLNQTEIDFIENKVAPMN